jgi:hypothetical protein
MTPADTLALAERLEAEARAWESTRADDFTPMPFEGLLKEAAAALRESVAWRPIETEQKDGIAILAASIHHDTIEVVCWQDGVASGSITDEPEEGWVNDGPIKDRFYANPSYFTHWQPIPLLPIPTPAVEVKP